jgi:outer membrane lipoprotein-sorting protein
MKNLITFIFAFTIFGLQAQDLQEVLDSYFETIGQEKLIEHTSMTAKGKSIQQGMETDFVVYQKRPDSFRLEVDIQGAQMIQAFDGEKGWMVAPWTGSLDPVEISGWQLDAMARQSDFDGMLYNYKEKGYEAELIGTEDMEGTDVFKIKLTAEDGNVYYHFIDSENFVLLKTTSKIKMGDSEIESDTYFSNYKEKDGIIMPYNIESRTNGQTASQVNMDEVIFDEEIDNSIFTMPEKKVVEEKGEEDKEENEN